MLMRLVYAICFALVGAAVMAFVQTYFLSGLNTRVLLYVACGLAAFGLVFGYAVVDAFKSMVRLR